MNKTLKKTVACFLTVLMLLTSIPLEGIAEFGQYLLDFGLRAGAVETVLESGSCGAEGSDVTWTLYDGGKLVISGSGAMADYYFEEPPAKKETAQVLSASPINEPEPADEQEDESVFTDLLSESEFQIVDVPAAVAPATFAAETYEAAESEVESQAVLTPWYDYTYEIQSVVIEEGITHIGDYAFAFFTAMTDAQLPQSLVSIGIGAFVYCKSLQAIDLPDGLEEIGETAFLYCFEIKQLILPQSLKTIGAGAFDALLSLESLVYPGSDVNLSEEGVFVGLVNLKELTIPEDAAESEGLNSLLESSFKVENIYNYSDTIVASDKMYYFDSYELADYLSIYYEVIYKLQIECAFNGTEPDELTFRQAFIDEVNRKYNTSYTLVDFESLMFLSYPSKKMASDFLTIHCKQASAEHETCKANFASHVLFETEAECLCFADNMNGTAGDTVTWSVNPETKTLTFSGSGETVFEEFPPYRSFSKYIENVEFAEDSAITGFGNFAFAGLKNLETLTLPEGTTLIGDQCFYNSGLKVLNLPASLENISSSSFLMGTTPIEEIMVDEENENFCSVNGALYAIETDPDYGTYYQLVKMPEASLAAGFKEDTVAVWPYSFEGYHTVTKIDLPDSVLEITQTAFFKCTSLKTVAFGAGETKIIGDDTIKMGIANSFAVGCNNMVSIEVDERNTEYTAVDGMLCNKDVTTLIYCPRAKETAVIPSTVTEIGYGAFEDCYKIESVDIPESVERIGRDAFYRCLAMESVNFAENGKLTEIGFNAFGCCPLQTVTVPASVTSIARGSFDCDSLTDITVMNALCTIALNSGTLGNSNTVIHGHIGSTAEDYADYNSQLFRALNGVEITSISVDTSNAKLQYQQYDNFDTGGIVVTAHYSDGTSVEKTNGVSYSGFDSSTIGVCTVTVTFRDFTAQFDVAIGEIPAEEITLNSSVSADVNGQEVYYKFVPEKSGTVKFYSSESSKNTVGRIYDSNLTFLSENYGYCDFSFEYDVTAGETYYLSVRFRSSSSTGTINATLECVHNYTHETVEPATCTEDGTKNSTCTVCGYSFISEIPPLGHRYQSQTVTEATCTTDGLRRYTCSVCGDTYDEPIPASHTDVDDDAICDVCGEICQGIIASGSCGENLIWTLYENKLLRISGTGEMTDYFNTSNPFYANRGNIERVIIEEGATNISSEAFSSLNNLVSVFVPASVTSIDKSAFAGSTLTTITFAQNSQLETIGEGAFHFCDDLTEINMPSTVTSIGEGAFYYCLSLTAVNIPAGVTQIAENTFSYCDSLSTLVFEENSQLETIGKEAFYFCRVLTEFNIPSAVTSIGESAFNSCGSLTAVNLPSSVTTIGEYAFQWCSITSLTFAENGALETIGNGAFSSNEFENVFIPDTVKTLGDRAFAYCLELKKIDVDADNPNYCSVDGVLFNKDKTVLIQYPVGKADTAYSIPHGVETIDKYAFAYLGTAHTGENVGFNGNYGDYAVSVTIPDTVSTISDHAFYDVAMTDVIIPESVKTLGQYAFHCYYLNNITVMNPQCVLSIDAIIPLIITEDKDGDGAPDISWGTIKGYTASTAEDYAEMCSIPFESLDDRYVTGVEIIELPSKVDYIETESFSTSGLKLRVTYDDNSTAEKLYGFTAEGFNRTNYGTSTITVTYKGFSDTYDITITEVPELKAGEKLNINSKNRSGWFKFISTVEKSYSVSKQTDSTDYVDYDYSVYNSDMEYSSDHRYTDKSFTAGEIYYIYYSFSSSDLPDDLTISVKCRSEHEYAETSRIEPTCTETGTVVYNCTVCTEEKTETIDPLGHDYSAEWTIDKQPDCTTDGSKSHHCTRCDSKTDITVVPALGHDMGEYVQTKAPTCTAKGSEKSTCSRCSYYETRDIDPLGHDYSAEWTIDKQPTCTLDGSKSHHCSRCDSKADVTVIPADGHSYTSVVTDPTCTADGFTTYTCSLCGHRYKDDVVAALGHDYSAEWTVDRQPTCTQDGSKSHHCSRCDSKADVTAISALGHDLGEYIEIKAPTCTAKGTEKSTCSRCSYYDTRDIDPLGHDYSTVWTVDLQPTCTSAGSKSHHCSRCDSKTDITEIPVDGHSYTSVVTAPTCITDGYTTYTCSVCGHSYADDVVSALGHDMSEYEQIKAPTCTETGTEKSNCSRCDYYETRDIDSLGHDYSTEWITDKQPTCTEAGSKSHHCSRCDSKADITEVPAKGHSYTSAVTDPTCTADGYTTYTCSVCGHSYTDDVVSAFGHDMSEFEQIKAPTCTENGTEKSTCSRCSYYETRTISASGHNYGEWKTVKEATVLAEGSRERTCSVCGKKETSVIDRIEVDIDNTDEYGLAIFTVVNAQTLNPIKNASIFISTQNDGENTFNTDENGQVRVVLPVGSQNISAYADGCLVRNLTVTIKTGTNNIPKIGLSSLSTYDVEIKHHLMDYDEIVEAGIDVSNPDNQHVYRYELRLEFVPEIDWISFFYYMNGVGQIVGGGGAGGSGGGGSGGGWISSGTGGCGYYYRPASEGKEAITVYPVSEYFYLIIRGEVRWLKEMFDVEMLVVNNSMTDTLEDLTATLTLPDGLSLATMVDEQQSLVQQIENIPEGESKSVHWYVRGDKAGSYDIEARLQGMVMPFEEPIDDIFKAEKQLQVWAGDALRLHFEFPNSAYYGEDYPVKITLTNVSDITLYNVTHRITYIEQGRVTYYSDGSKDEEVYMSASDASWYEFVPEFKPGDKIVIELDINIMFESKLMEYQIQQMINKVNAAEQFINGYKAVKAGLDAANTLINVITGCSVAIGSFLSNPSYSSIAGSKADLFKTLHSKISSLQKYATSGNKTFDSAAKLINTGLSATLNAITEDPETWLKNSSYNDVKSVLKDVEALEKTLIPNVTEEDVRNFNIFDSIRTLIEALPVKFTLVRVLFTEEESNTTDIPWSYSVTQSGPRYFGVSNMGSYLSNISKAIMAEIYEETVPSYVQRIPGLDDPMNYNDVKREIIAVEKEIEQFKAKDATGEVTFRAYYVENTNAKLRAFSAADTGYVLECDNETAKLENGVLTFTGDGTISLTPLNTNGGTLYIEDSEGNNYEYDITVVPEHECVAGEEEVIVTPTDEYDGFAVKCCSVCDDVMEIINLSAADCSEHSFGEWKTELEPSCEASGIKNRVCKNCGYTETDFIDATGHTEVTVNQKDATCMQSGYSGDIVCQVCGTEISSGSELQALGHDMSDFVLTKAPNCTEAGQEKSTCSRCEYAETRDVEASGHDYSEVVTKPTCTIEGYTTHICKNCGNSYISDYTEKLGHSYEDEVNLPTCTELGYTTHTCSRCFDSYVDNYVEATGHVDENSDGYCDKCGTNLNPSANCSCMCHKTGFVGFIYKIIRVFWKLFKINKTCECGASHY